MAEQPKRPGRNARCYCGSGRKFKACCMAYKLHSAQDRIQVMAKKETCIFEDHEHQAEGYGKFLRDSCTRIAKQLFPDDAHTIKIGHSVVFHGSGDVDRFGSIIRIGDNDMTVLMMADKARDSVEECLEELLYLLEKRSAKARDETQQTMGKFEEEMATARKASVGS